MAFSRYQNRVTFKNEKDLYKKHFDVRDVNFIRQFRSANYTYPTDEQLNSLDTVPHIWKRGDRLYKLAHKHYGSSELWWIIAWFNKKPSEAMYDIGDAVMIPFPVDRVLEFMGL